MIDEDSGRAQDALGTEHFGDEGGPIDVLYLSVVATEGRATAV